MVNYLSEKQRAPFRPAVQEPRQPRWDSLAIESGRQIFFDTVFVEKMEPQFLTQSARLQLLNRRAEWVFPELCITGTVGADDEQAGRLVPMGQARNQVHGRMVGPMQIFQNQQHRLTASQHLDGLDHFPQHSVSRRAQNSPLQSLQLVAA